MQATTADADRGPAEPTSPHASNAKVDGSGTVTETFTLSKTDHLS